MKKFTEYLLRYIFSFIEFKFHCIYFILNFNFLNIVNYNYQYINNYRYSQFLK